MYDQDDTNTQLSTLKKQAKQVQTQETGTQMNPN